MMKQRWFTRPGAGTFLLISYCLWGAVSLRWITEFIEHQHPLTWAISLILLIFGVAIGLEPLLTNRSTVWAHIYLASQMMLVFVGSLFFFELDFFAMLYFVLCGQASFLLPQRQSFIWTAILIVTTVVAQIIQFGIPVAFSFILLYVAGLIFVAAFVRLVLRANDARQRSEQLLTDLQSAHQQLQTYANQAEELAIANERTRLARDLHDSVAQTLYGLTLQAEAASRKLTTGQTEVVQSYLATIQEDAKQTLQDTRLLIFELRPPILENSGLTAALQARLDSVEARSGLTMQVTLGDAGRLPEKLETDLYRIAQEALNNVAKHAQANALQVTLQQINGRICLQIKDDGIGFEPMAVSPGSVGLQGMAERVAQLNGRLTIDSAPGQGTNIQVEVPL
ncbi:sensor histidine kinase [Candidatus Leptofilum sp.]|uniref:sensor histidine kinase n=1 Tax=Candidatus Leptofilum sp. TaxID=3241576 RepID=UPI003B5B3FA1